MQRGREGAGTLCALVPGLSFVFHLFLSPAQQGGCGREKTSVRLWDSSAEAGHLKSCLSGPCQSTSSLGEAYHILRAIF